MNLPPEIDKLLQAYFAGNPSPEIIAAVEGWLRQDSSHPRILAEYGLVDRLIACEQKKMDASAIFASLLEAEEAAEPIQFPTSTVAEAKPESEDQDSISLKHAASVLGYAALQVTKARAGYLAAVAAIVLISMALLQFLPLDKQEKNTVAGDTVTVDEPSNRQDTPATLRPVATITATQNAVWFDALAERAFARGSALTPGTPLHPNDRLTLTQGFAEITTNDGAIAILQAPATIELINNNNAIRLHTGKLVGICETESSKGFLVRTPHMDITDIGTEFGVEVSDRRFTATVFSGEIELTSPNIETKRLLSSQTARLQVNGEQRDFIIDDRLAEGFLTRLPADPLVISAQINDPQFHVEVIPQGLIEHAKVHTDRTHQIVALKGSAVPDALIGGDLIRTPGDARPGQALDDLEIAIELARNADVYVLFSNGPTIPDWLTRDYTLTQMQVGLNYIDRPHAVRAGRTLQVWKRNQTADPGKHIVGGPMTDESAYFVVAVSTKDPSTHTKPKNASP